MDNASLGKRLLLHEAELEQLPIPGFEYVVVVDGEQVGRGGSHVDFVVVWLWEGRY